MRKKIAIIGLGRLGPVLFRQLQRLSMPITAMVDLDKNALNRMSRRFPSIPAGVDCSIIPPETDAVFIAVVDDAISQVARQLDRCRFHGPLWAIHTSGALSSEALRPLKFRASMHPCYSFTETREASFSGLHFILDGEGSVVQWLHELVEHWQGVSHLLSAEHKTVYHAACTLASNGFTALMGAVDTLLQEIPDLKGLQPLVPLIQGTWQNVQNQGPVDALTGPVSRGDTETVSKHIQSILQTHPDLLKLYVSLSHQMLSMNHESRLPIEKRHVLQKILDNASL